MQMYVAKNAQEMGKVAAGKIADKLKSAIKLRGEARLLLSTGASQFETLEALCNEDLKWNKVTAFHLDEYLGIDADHPASFRKYLYERFASKVPVREMVYVNTTGNVEDNIQNLTQRVREKPIDVGVIGIGENAHIAFNDPPANLESKEAYHIVQLNDTCRKQQVGEGWFKQVQDVPQYAVSMTPYQIMLCQSIVSPVPGARKAKAIAAMLNAHETDAMIPATLLKTHHDFMLFLDEDSAPKDVLEFK
ncbi:6-phosphogluconolactonase [uncultured Ruthenibacterium sp.]|uniref:6-phosphogluconolactonase n=1 Tax=uncultured Ruthenibacterium sp. TaxID=1905347 RepID=UPI00349EC6FB